MQITKLKFKFYPCTASIHVQHIDGNILQCEIFCSQVCPPILLSDIIDKIRVLNSKLYSFLQDVKASKLAKLFGPRSVSSDSTGSANEINLVFTIPPDLPLSDPERSICPCERSQVNSQLRANWFLLHHGRYRNFFPPFTSSSSFSQSILLISLLGQS